ncbi:DUF885 family protein [Rufibacter psychrotolerans]|uniref:DUF885 family protein n=1 Tax=Rufibacter psychrotolerans TaxID=2812556 RepID=UPI0019674194|nr:DUF885 family protein [Rufibacter sp. SYSU D00308]
MTRRWPRFLTFSCLTIVFTLLSSGSIFAQSPHVLYEQTSEVNNLLVKLKADEGSLRRFYFMENSPEFTARFQKLYQEYQQQLNTLNYDQLNTGSRVDYLLTKRNLAEELRLLDVAAKEYSQVSKWVPFAEKIYALEKPRRRGLNVDGQKIATELNLIEKSLKASQTALEAEPRLDRDLAYRLQGVTLDLKDALKSVYTFYYDYEPSFSWWTKEPYKKVDTLLTQYAALAEKKGKVPAKGQKIDQSGIVGNPIGKDELIRQLQYEMIPYTPEELIDIANKEFAWCDQEMLKASQEMGFGKDWHAALEKVKNLYVPAGKQPEAMLDLYNQSVAFLKEKDLITIPPVAEETWRMLMMSPERQLVNPFFLGGETFIISYPTSTMAHEDKLMSMRGNNPHFSRATVHHELIAGHHLQGFMNNRYKAYRDFNTPFWTEGWSLYWEMLLWDQKFPRSAEDRVGMLFWRMHRCARIIFSLNYHLGKWTPQECIDFLVDRVGHERANAEGEVRRSFEGRYSPLYQLAYMIGGLQFYALHKELVQTGKMTNKQFHDAIIQENNLPVEMVRAILLNQPLPKDFTSNWRFYGNANGKSASRK